MSDPPAPSGGPASPVPGLSGLAVIARGGYATVYRATQESVGRAVALKIDHRTLETDRDQRRFVREARAAGRMSSHPHVVDLFDAGVTADGHPFLVMELCQGSYGERLKSGRLLTPAEARDLGLKIADALADAHELGVLHRDVKPANILVSDFGEPALADFGLAMLAESRDTSITLDVLTPAYAAPETFRQAPPTASGDVYSLCATLYALLRGRPPRWYSDRTPSLLTLVQMFNEPIPDLPGVPPDLLDLLRRGMASDPSHRPSAAWLRDAFAALRIDTPSAGAPPFVPLPISTPPPAAPPISTALPANPSAFGSQPPGIPPYDEAVTQDLRAVTPPPPGPTPSRPRWADVIGGLVAGVLTVGLLVGGGSLTRGHADPTPSASATPAPTTAAPTTAAPVTGGCKAIKGADCPSPAECFDRLRTESGAKVADTAPCTTAHTWETFARGRLSELTTTLDGLPFDVNVIQLCDKKNLALALGGARLDGWQTNVLPPTRKAFNTGDRTFRCLAGQGPAALNHPVFVK